MNTYRAITNDGDSFEMQVDLVQASAPIYARWNDGAWQSTPYQTADAAHDLDRAAYLVASRGASQGDDEWDDDQDGPYLPNRTSIEAERVAS